MQHIFKIILAGSILLNVLAIWGFFHYVRFGGSPLGELKRRLTGETHQPVRGLPYADENAQILAELEEGRSKPNRVVFFGASITARWDLERDFTGVTCINRGVGNQLAPAMLARFKRDVLDLKPDAVVIKFCSINVRPTLPNSVLRDAMTMMVGLARSAGIKPIVCTIIPAGKPEAHIGDFSVVNTLGEFNEWVRGFAAENELPLIDYAGAIADDSGFLPREYSTDPVHVNERGYEILAAAAKPVLGRIVAGDDGR